MSPHTGKEKAGDKVAAWVVAAVAARECVTVADVAPANVPRRAWAAPACTRRPIENNVLHFAPR